MSFLFNYSCLITFKQLKEKLVIAPIVTALDWKLDFKLMFNATNYAIGAVLGLVKSKFSMHYTMQENF